MVSDRALAQAARRGCRVSSGEIQNPLGHDAGQSAPGDPVWAGGWSRWPPGVTSNLSHSVIPWREWFKHSVSHSRAIALKSCEVSLSSVRTSFLTKAQAYMWYVSWICSLPSCSVELIGQQLLCTWVYCNTVFHKKCCFFLSLFECHTIYCCGAVIRGKRWTN